jgi:heterotetrameric sarcosine oxidase delta subunit
MQRFNCPYCGRRDEREFRYIGDAGKQRPDTSAQVSDDRWSDYLYAQDNAQGAAKEVWIHLPCQEVFGMSRNTTTAEVISETAFRTRSA